MSKRDFPIFSHHPELVYLDSAATAQKPSAVITAEKDFYEQYYAPVHRGIYRVSQAATSFYEGIREKVKNFIHAPSSKEIIFTKGTTESINLVASSFGLSVCKPGSEIVLSVAEHHANIIPWQEVAKKTGAKLIFIPLLPTGEIDFNAYQQALNKNTVLVTLSHISNVLGLINPVEKIIAAAHQKNIPVLLDGAQAVAHMPVDMRALDCDFYTFSAHKMYGPTGVGILYGKKEFLSRMPPYQSGGQMIEYVTLHETKFADIPAKFEAGTPNIAGVAGLSAAIDYIQSIGFDRIQQQEEPVFSYLMKQLRAFPGLKIYGDTDQKIAVASFTLDCAHPHDVATVLDQSNIAIRAGHHCAMPLMHYLNVPALSRVSLGLYNDTKDIDALIKGLHCVKNIFT